MNDSPDTRLNRLDRLAWLLDNSIPVPGTGIRIGLDGLIGLIPGIGDAVGAVLSSYIVAQAAHGGAPLSLILRMGLNIVIESFVGLVPIFGDLFDFGYKANARNVRLLRDHLLEPVRARTRSRFVVALLALGCIAVIGAFVILAIAVMRWAWQTATGA
jgi:hypothetical protein